MPRPDRDGDRSILIFSPAAGIRCSLRSRPVFHGRHQNELGHQADQVRRVGGKFTAFIIFDDQFTTLIRVIFQLIVFLYQLHLKVFESLDTADQG